jgi:hypothetical protein
MAIEGQYAAKKSANPLIGGSSPGRRKRVAAVAAAALTRMASQDRIYTDQVSIWSVDHRKHF